MSRKKWKSDNKILSMKKNAIFEQCVASVDSKIKHRQIVGMKRYFSTPAAHEKRKTELRKCYEDPNERLKLSVAQKKKLCHQPRTSQV